MKKKLNLFIITLLISTLFFGFMSTPVSATLNRVDWDDYSVGSTSGSSTFYNWARSSGDDFRIVTHSINGSTKSLWFDRQTNLPDDPQDIMNIYFDYTEGTVVNSTKFDVDFWGWHSWSDTSYGYLMLRFYEDGTEKIRIRISGSAGGTPWQQRVQVLDANGTYHTLTTDYEDSNYLEKTIFINQTTQGTYGQKFEYTVINRTTGDIENIVELTGVHWEGTFDYIDRIYIYDGESGADGVGGADGWLGNFDMHQYTEGEEEEENYDVSQWNYIGDLDRDVENLIAYMGLEEEYQILFTGEIKAVDIYVDAYQKNSISGLLADYGISINGVLPMTHPVAFIPYGENYLLRWYWLNQSIEDEYVTFEFVSTGEDDYNFNWHTMNFVGDNDGDGETGFRFGEDMDFWLNGIFDQIVHSWAEDLSMRFYYEGDLFDPNYNYTDYVGVKNIPPYYTFANLPISYTVSTKEYDNYMEIWRDGYRMGEEQGFGGDGDNGKFLTEYSETIGFVPTIAGSYSVNIVRNGANVTAFSFTVLDNPITDYYIYTIPNPSQFPQAFTVYYKYYHGEGKNGILTIHHSQTFSDPLEHMYYIYLSPNTTGNFSYTPPSAFDLLYISMGIEISDAIYTLASFPNNPYIHYIKDFGSSNYIDLAYLIIDLEVSAIQTVTGHHNHIGAYVYITDNGEIIRDVSHQNSFSFNYNVVNAGSHEVKLILSTANGTVTLDTKYYVASTGITPPEDEDEFSALGDYKIWLGVGIIVLFLLMPLGISMKAYVDVPLMVYIAMGSIGAGVAVSLGLLELYWLLLLLVALVTGAVISKWGL